MVSNFYEFRGFFFPNILQVFDKDKNTEKKYLEQYSNIKKKRI